MNKKGFTLIELLAVIVILAIIAAIAIPIVLNIIDDTKEESELRSIEFYLEALELSIAQSTLDDKNINDGTYEIIEKGNVCLSYGEDNKTCKEKLEVEVKGEVPKSGSVVIKNNKIKEATLILKDKKILKNNKGELIYDPYEELSNIGIPPFKIENSKDSNLIDYKIYGNSIQEGTPSPDNPIPVESVGDYDETTGKYKIPIKVNGKATNIYLNEPLRKIGEYVDYIDFKNKKIVRNVFETKFIRNVKNSSIYGKYTNVVRIGNRYETHKQKQNVKILSHILNLDSKGQFHGNKETIFHHGTTNYNYYFSLSWERLGLIYDGSNVYKINDTTTILTNSEVLDIAWNYVLSLPEEQKKIYMILDVPTEETIELPDIQLNKGTNVIDVDTKIQPSNMEFIYEGRIRY